MLNIPLLQKFFLLDELKELSSEILMAKPMELNMWKFKFYKHDIKKEMAVDEKLKLDLNKASELVKQDAVIINSLSEAVVLEKYKFHKIFGQHGKELQWKLLQDW